jgi:hypothetical protein
LARESHLLEGIVFYAHTKGAGTPAPYNADWRRRMTYHTVTQWREARKSLASHHAYGCYWMQLAGSWLFGGNFWWTQMSYLRALSPPQTHSRWAAESWIGLLPQYIPDFTVCDPAGPFPGKIVQATNETFAPALLNSARNNAPNRRDVLRRLFRRKGEETAPNKVRRP